MTPDESADDVVRLTFDAQADAAYLMLGSGGEGEVSRSIPVGLGGSDQDVDVVLDIDANGCLVGVEVLGATLRLAPEVIAAARRLDS